ncbi:DNA-binding domain-containing protein [Xylophilus ampelinus]|uniref:Putative transposase n=1 Tax=Xylophilus ampelinus TaxID=54067 RepID=A0A318SHS7_9BURK|nr:Mu transposase C-terminal domain-containing protein [Xylophilus ampelinus]MCS4509968.1 Mu transposase C-terminal domain-containing protein [Xylophilus ampelinus]PYE78454.1 putative transposase [Xylophilus ampelinus]
MSRLIPGSPVVWKDRSWILLDIPAVDRVLIRDPETGHMELASPTDLRTTQVPNAGRHGLMSIPTEDWNEAWNRFQAIRPLLDRGPRQRTRQEVDEVAKNFGKDTATVYRWITKWKESRTVSALIRSGRSDNGKSRLSDAVEVIIRHEIDTFYLGKERPTIVELWERVAMACRKQGLKAPNMSTMRRRVDRLQDRLVVAKRYSSKQAREIYEPIRGSFPGADVPLAVYQIDHSPIDIILVDEKHRRPIGRGYLTIVTDSCTRMLTGFCASLDPPGALSTGLAMAHAILPKAKWLAERGIDTSWPINGIPAKVFADNAAEFRGTMLERACREYGILMENRPKGQPNYGGHVERLFRTFMHRAQSLPGSTFSNTLERGEYDSDGRAVMTLAEFENWFTVFVTKVYHQRPHSGIGRVPPVKLFEQFVLGTSTTKGIGLPEPIHDEYKLRLDFMPFVERTIQEYGVVIDNIHYYGDVLRPWIHGRDPHNAKLKRKFVFARDPRDIGEIYFLDPETGAYYPVPYRNLTRPRISVWDLNAALKRIAEQPELQPDEDTIFEGLAEMTRIEQTASETSRKVRRTAQRRANWHESTAAREPRLPPTEPPWQPDVQPFDDIEEAE